MNILGIITARGGSKRVPRKNIRDFLGKPLLAWSVESGKSASVFDRFILSTDDPEIAEVGRRFGIEVPFMRPPELAEDTSGSYGVIVHAVEWMEKHGGFKPDWIVLLEPSAPGRQPFHIREVVELAKKGVADSIVGISVMPAHFSHLKEMKRDERHIITRATDGEILRNLIHRNQDIPETYFINSTIYAMKYDNLFDGHASLWGNSTYGYLMDEKYAIDIDTELEWLIAEVKMKAL
jgi:CMP-N,N'-diacetyllegionaminic acid synthase